MRSGFAVFVFAGNSRPLSTVSQICERRYRSPSLLKTTRSTASVSFELNVTGAFKIAVRLVFGVPKR